MHCAMWWGQALLVGGKKLGESGQLASLAGFQVELDLIRVTLFPFYEFGHLEILQKVRIHLFHS